MLFSCRSSVYWLIASALLFLSPAFASDKAKSLEKVQQQIVARQSLIAQRKKEISAQEVLLKRSDLEIGRLSRNVAENRSAIEKNRIQFGELKKKESQLEQSRQLQQKALSLQLQSAYRTGHYDYLKVLFNQQEPGRIERTLTYYRYLNEARLESLVKLKQLLSDIDETKLQLSHSAKELESLSQSLQEQLSALEKEKKKKEIALGELKKLLDSDQTKLVQLQEAEIELQTAIQKAMRELARTKSEGLTLTKGKLLWPVKGKVLHRFGSRYTGQLKRKGVVISSPEGRSVKAVHAGQVVFANWLKGYGLVMVIDHGKGYMSLYGYNQSLLKEVGENVDAGESVATVGSSGGQSSSALYFELRYQGKPIDPLSWLN